MLQTLFQKWLPKPPPYDPVHAQHLPLRSRRRLGAQAWALQGYGAPWILILFHIVKMIVYLGVWVGFVWLHSDPGLSHSDVFFSIEAFQRFILWSLLFEVLGFGCGSGPLTGRYAMPFGAFWHFFRPGTIRLRPFSRLWKKANATRGLLDVAVFTCHVLCLLALLFSPTLEAVYFLPSILLFVIMSLRDQVFFLASRGEHYGVILICFAFGEEGIAGAMVVQSSIWLWAALSKCTPHFPSVLCAMTSNSPILKHPRIRKQLYVHFPNDLRPSRSAHRLAQLGTLVEFAFPLLLLFGQGGVATTLGLGIMIVFHVYICSNLPAAVPLEWNAITIYSGIFLFQNGGWHVYAFDSPLLILWLITACFLVPLYCNICPKKSSFLLGMRYYAGNWAYTTWLIRRKVFPKLNKIPRASQFAHEQLESLYPPEIVYGVMQRVEAFRTLHLHGRILPHLIETALDEEEASSYQIVDGELIAGSLLGWNFGDGHLSGPNLLKAVQEICQLEPGDIRIICVEAQPLFRRQMEWDIFDAARGLQRNGDISVSQLSEMKI